MQQKVIAVAAVVVLAAVAAGIVLLNRDKNVGFLQNQKVSAAGEMRLLFPEQMNHDSVLENLDKPAGFDAETAWDNEALVFKPKTKWETGKTYSFHLSGKARKADGTPLGRSMDFSFEVTGAPALVTHVPAQDAVGIPSRSKIALIFDRPMVPLTQVQGKNSTNKPANWPVTVSPAIPGRWRWLGTTTAEYAPEKELPLATTFTVSVPAGIETHGGEKTEKDFSWSFETLRPDVDTMEPPAGSELSGPKTEVVLRFNQPVDLASVKQNVTMFREPATPEKRAQARQGLSDQNTVAVKSVVYAVEENAEKKKVTNKSAVVLIPASPLAFDSAYTVTVLKGLRATVGDLGSKEDRSFTFRTVGKPRVLNHDTEYGQIHVRFNNPMDSSTIKKNMVISPEPAGWKDIEFGADEWTEYRDINLYLPLKPSTTYKVTLKAGIADKFGQRLDAPYEFSFSTKPLDPEVYIHSKGEFGIFEKGKAPVYYLNGVNVSQLDVALSRMSVKDFMAVRAQRAMTYDAAITAPAEVQKWTLTPDFKKDTWKSVPFDPEKQTGKPLGGGVYMMSVQAPEYRRTWGDNQPVVQYQFFTLTNMSITLKYSGDKALVWVTDMQTGDAVTDATIQLYSLNGTVVTGGRTDKDGFFETVIDLKKFVTASNDWQPEFWVTAEKNGDLAFAGNNWSDGIRPYDFSTGIYEDFHNARRPKYRVQSYLYTERDVYRPGDTVNFKGIVRFLDWNGQMTVPDANRKVLVRINDAENKEVYSKTVNLTAFGGFSDSFKTAPDSSIGQYYMTAAVTPDTDATDHSISANFSVLAYRKPEYLVNIVPEKEEYLGGETVKTDIEGAYYFGAPMAGSHVRWFAQTTDYYFNQYTDGWYSFALEDSWCWESCERGSNSLTEGEGTLDATGHLDISFPVPLDDKGVSQVVSIEASITDLNNQEVSNRSSVIVHKSGIYTGIRSDDYVVTPGGNANMSVVTVKPDGTPAPDTAVNLKLYKREWNTTREKGVDGEYYYNNEPKDTFVREVNSVTDSQGKTLVAIPVDEGGELRVVASAKDPSGRESKAGTSLYAWSSTYYNWPHSNDNRVEVIADKPEYKIGETAKLLVKSPYQGKGVTALVTVERENVITRRVMDVEGNALPIEVPVTEDLLPNAYVSVVIIKPRMGETFNEHGLDTGVPAFKVGYAKIPAETKSKKLNLELSTDKKKYGPGEKVTVTLKTTDADKRPVSAEVSLGVVDMSVLALTGFELPDPVAIFYANRGLGVQTSQMLIHLLERFKPGSKGGGGGDPEERARSNFKDTAYWNPTVLTDANGNATLSFTLPDNLTTWQLLAIADTRSHLFGAVAETIVETKRVILRPVRPRFAVSGDEAELGAIVHNFTDDPKTFKVTLNATNATPATLTREVTVQPDRQTKVEFPVTIGMGDETSFDFEAKTDGAVDRVIEKIPVLKFGVMQADATSGVTEASVTENVLVPTKEDAPRGDVSISVSPSIATYLPAGLEYLVTYPYGCAEQTASSFLPNVALASLQNFDAFTIVDDKTLEKNVSAGIQRLYTFQRGDGGFGYWQDGDRSYTYLSAYIVYALQTSKAAGHSVDNGVLDSARNYLGSALRRNTDEYGLPLDLSTRAFILFVLAEGGKADAGMLNAVYEKRAELPVFSKAQLAMAMHKNGTQQMQQKAKTLMEDIMNLVRIDNRGAHFEEENERQYGYLMNTNTRTSAYVMQAMARITPEHALLPRVVRRLLEVRKDGHWDTTQSTSATILAFIDYLKATDELDADMRAAVDVAGKTVVNATFDASNVLTREEVTLALDGLARGKEVPVRIGKEGTGRLYYDVLLSYFYTPKTIDPIEQGVGILREMTPLDPKTTGVKVGETYKITLTVTVPEDRHFVAVESPLPAGFEAIDFNVRTVAQNELSGEVNAKEQDVWSYDYWRNGLWRFNHIEFRDDQVFLFADELPSGIYEYEYLVRATLPGKFRYRPARVWEMYFPEVFGQTDGDWLTINE